MNDFFVILHFNRYEFGDSLVLFHLPASSTSYDLTDEFGYQKCDLEVSDYDEIGDYAQELCNRVAAALSGTWDYAPLAGTIDLSEE